MEHFNQLSPAEAERLAVLLEEMGEAQQAIGKILRHGYESKHPDGGPTNRETLEREVGDVIWAIENLCNNDDMGEHSISTWVEVKARKVQLYLHHQQ